VTRVLDLSLRVGREPELQRLFSFAAEVSALRSSQVAGMEDSLGCSWQWPCRECVLSLDDWDV